MRNYITSCLVAVCVAVPIASARADDAAPKEGLQNESGAGIVVTSGNSTAESLNFEQKNAYHWDENTAKFFGKYLYTSANSVESAQYWTLGLRYERNLFDGLGVYAGEAAEGDPFSGYLQRYNTDVGAKYSIIKNDEYHWNVEGGYRYTIENDFTGQVDQNYLRAFTEIGRDWGKEASLKASVEYLPNLTDTSDFQLNTDVSATAAMNSILSIKVEYLVKFRKLPPPPALKQTDTQFTTSLVAKF